jgi:hypothetical protein
MCGRAFVRPLEVGLETVLITCNRCSTPWPRRFRSRARTTVKIRYEDADGRLWASARVCPACRRVDDNKNYSDRGARRASLFVGASTGSRNEVFVVNCLKSLGHIGVVRDGGPGRPDVLFVDRSGVSRFVEVKTACVNGAANNDCWRTCAVADSRKSDDLVAIVLPSKRIHWSTMSDHLLLCATSGSRSVTAIVRKDRVSPAKDIPALICREVA